ncbi:MAG: hypothetical protein GMKNLPBB_01854 [Myxococcota bacterium]|nr:hypothetical protein [Myxococcota bacterium]
MNGAAARIAGPILFCMALLPWDAQARQPVGGESSDADRIAAQRRYLDELAASRKNLIDELEAMEAEIASIRRKKADLLVKADALRQEQPGVEAKFNQSQTRLDELLSRFRERLRALQKSRGQLEWAPAVIQGDLNDLVWTRRQTAALVEADRRLVRTVQNAWTAALERKRELDRLLAEIGENYKQTADAELDLSERLSTRKAFLGELKSREDLGKRFLAQLTAARKQAEQQIRTIVKPAPAKPERSNPPAALKRGAVFPSANGRLESVFGQKPAGAAGDAEPLRGWIVRGETESPVLSAFKGRVVFSGRFRGYGNLVIVDHGDSIHTLYAHLAESAVEVGDELAAGAVLGVMGDSGSPDGIKLYFELRRHGKPVDPSTLVPARK